jgi:hypothetical protein
MTKLPRHTTSSLVPHFLTAVFLIASAGCGNSTTALSKSDGGAGTSGSGSAGTKGGAGTSGTPGTAGSGGPGTAGNGGGAGSGYDGSVVGVDAATKIPLGMTQCSDGIDNDKDGLIDSADPECTGPNDNDESTYATGIPGDNIDACKQDCFFDGNSGMGDDGCEWQLQCDPRSKNAKCPFDQSYVDKHAMTCSVSASQSDKCISNCRKYVPNGCDCFGCCAVPGAPTPIHLDPTCTAKDFGDPTKCSPCTQVTQCMNPCDRCEICVGKPTVPADCAPPPPTGYDGGTPADGGDGGTYTPPPTPDGGGYHTCTDGIACTPGGDNNCPNGYGCVFGCCTPVVQ